MVATAVGPDVFRTLSESNRDAADFYGRKAERYESFRHRIPTSAEGEELDVFLRHYAREAVSATRDLVAVVEQVEGLWAGAIRFLKAARVAKLAVGEQISHLREFIAYAESAGGLIAPVSRLWAAVGGLGGDAAGAGELTDAVRRLNQVYREAYRAVDARVNPWQPKDLERYEREMRDYVPGGSKTLTPDEAKAYFRRPRAEG